MQAARLLALLLLLELVELGAALGLGAWARLLWWGDQPFDMTLVLRGGVLALVIILSFYANDLYAIRELPTRTVIFRRYIVSMTVAVVLMTILYYLAPSLELGRVVFSISLSFFTIFFFLGRTTLGRFLAQRVFKKRYLILGAGDFALELGQTIMARRRLGYDLIGFLAPEPERVGEPLLNPGIIGHFEQVAELAREHKVDEIVIAASDRRGAMPMEALLDLKFHGVTITDGVTFYEREHDRVSVRNLNPSWMIFNDGFNPTPLTLNAKRVMDISLALVGLLLTFPMLVVVALLVKVTSPGPIFYVQERAGLGGKPFNIFKFRSMTTGAEKGTPQFAQQDDPRVTPLGRFIRKTRIDELPQLINILRGDMSLVGPRPERPYFIAQLCERIPFYNYRLRVKPGLTGLAQVTHGYSGAEDDDHLHKLQYDLSYIKNLSIVLDLSIIAKTIKVVLIGKGAR